MTVEVVHADCVDVLPGYEGKVDLIVTSPPYDDMREYSGESQFDFDAAAPLMVAALRDGGVLCWNVADQQREGDWSLTSFRQAVAFQDMGLKCRERLVYQRSYRQTRAHRCYARNTELVMVMTKGADVTFNPLVDVPNMTAGRSRFKDGTGRQGDKLVKTTDVLDRLTTKDYGIRGEIWYYPVG